MRFRRWSLSASLCWIALTTLPLRPTRVRAEAATEYDVKAAFLYNFGKFVAWPPGALGNKATPFVIGILGEDPFGNRLDRMVHDQTVQDRKVVIQRLHSVEETARCQVVYLGRSEGKDLAATLQTVSARGVLTVSDISDFSERGGMFGLFVEGNKVRFSINLNATNRAGLTVSSQLLKLARKLIGTSRN
jgi:hypothetical protein